MGNMMKAVVLCGRGKVEFRDVPIPEIGDDDILLEIKACGICGSDLHFFFGVRDPLLPEPYIIGHEFAGIIAAKGKNVSEYWKIGDRVVSENTGFACGRCSSCDHGNYVACPQRKVFGCHMDGGFTKYVKIPGYLLNLHRNCMFHIPDGIPFPEATVLEPASCAYHALIQKGEFRSGENVVVFGAGALGLMSLQQANIAGACKAIMVGWSNAKKVRFDIAKKYGATHVYAASEEKNLVKKIRKICGPNGVSVVVDAAGTPSVTDQAIQIVRNEGVVVRVGMSFENYTGRLDNFALKNVDIRGNKGYNTESWRNSIALAECGKLDLKSIITHTLPLEEYAKGFELARTSDAAKVVLVP